jgi:hypothetical protein
MRTTISQRQDEVNTAIGRTDEQLAEIRQRMAELSAAAENQTAAEGSENRAATRAEIEEEHQALSLSRELLDQLLTMAHASFSNANRSPQRRQSVAPGRLLIQNISRVDILRVS